MTITEKIENVQKAVFDYETATVANNTVSVFSEIIEANRIDTRNANTVKRLNDLMGACLGALQNRDYLLLADLLEYELKPMVRR